MAENKTDIRIEGNTVRWSPEAIETIREARSREWKYAGSNTVRIPEWVQPQTTGSAAPQIEEPAPARREHEQVRPAKRPDRRVRRNQETVTHIGFGYAMFLSFAVVMLLMACMSLMNVQARIQTAQNELKSATTELQELRSDNDTRELYLNSSVDLQDVYRIATEELGMVYPSGSQVIYYNSTESGYVRQYQDIPTE